MVEMGIRLQLAPKEKGQRGTYLPPACYTMSKVEKTQFCECLRGIKVPSSYSANIKKLVSVQDCKLVGEIKARGPVFLRYMYPFERYMGILKGYVRIGARPEGSIVTGYLGEELIEFGNDAVKGVRNIGIPHSRHEGKLSKVGTIGLRKIDPDRDALKVAHSVVLQQMACITSYIEQHKQMLRATHRGRTNK
uniref:DUF4218 domain-containing protein n=1 Tax=Tanacetum cinerariifolium TaxID=118510 RepID=A0A699JSU1_TANCI|nr:hypothetical protein [Tanacetum cinerariifolium]